MGILFGQLCHGNKKSQKSLLGGVEKMIELHRDSLLPKTMHILKVCTVCQLENWLLLQGGDLCVFQELYDLDIVEEDVMIEWGSKPSKKYVSKELSTAIHSKAGPFIKWLQEAEEESSSDDDDDDDDTEVCLQEIETVTCFMILFISCYRLSTRRSLSSSWKGKRKQRNRCRVVMAMMTTTWILRTFRWSVVFALAVNRCYLTE